MEEKLYGDCIFHLRLLKSEADIHSIVGVPLEMGKIKVEDSTVHLKIPEQRFCCRSS